MPMDSTTAYLERHQPEKNMHRYYWLYVTPTLFGEFAVVREWGRIGKSGQRKEDLFDTLEQACGERERLAIKKRRKGYCDAQRFRPFGKTSFRGLLISTNRSFGVPA